LHFVNDLNVHRMMRYTRSCYVHPPDLHHYSAIEDAATVIVIVGRIFANSEMKGLVLLCMLILQSLPVDRRIVSSVSPLESDIQSALLRKRNSYSEVQCNCAAVYREGDC